ncbi:urokinase plasminogen activator surface receptor-like isoform X4 [Puntigrus tetrazona]|uniref:urokinase plasminogen activator surface receptor-like isoform X3 n=1 Tax=Puntigrus tetrazona TaxID=1606681 RepID=UPI001C8AA01C|nr:urokinase plasminogen activator surface receptor-like isoform X3 [Puntigrus tetrazona]XP_043090359.1 urokinase plasminogen activator surface receptor-like isoform X4 [Puntigrus tetrazona]
MDLQISVFLLISLFTAGHSLWCYECKGSCANEKIKTCLDGESQCLSSTTMIKVAGVSLEVNDKDCSADCFTGSVNYNIGQISSECCNTPLCNQQDISDISKVYNGLKCYFCDEKSCSNILRCTGDQDRCFKAEVNFRFASTVVKGCVSKSMCDAKASLKNVQEVSCCSGNLCNGVQSVTQTVSGVQSVTQSFLFLFCSLLSFILLH